MKRICLLLAGVLFFVNLAQAQSNDDSLRRIAQRHMIAIQELSEHADVTAPNSIVLMVFDVKNETDITPLSDKPIPVDDSLSYYRILTIDPHTNVHLMFVRKGKWEIIDMRKPLIDLMEQGISLCEYLDLEHDDSVFVFQEILRYEQINTRNLDGVPVVKTNE